MTTIQEVQALSVGAILYEGWGYDQTKYDFCKILEVHPSGKSLLCRMIRTAVIKSDRGGDTVIPAPGHEQGQPFRVLIKRGKNEPERAYLVGSYPFIIESYNNGEPQEHKRFAYWSIHKDGANYIETER